MNRPVRYSSYKEGQESMPETTGTAGDMPAVPLQLGREGEQPGAATAGTVRPALIAFQAVANLYSVWPALPDLDLTIHPSGAVVGRVPVALMPGEAEAALHAWREALSADPGAVLADTERVEGPFYWNQLAGEVPVYAPGARAQRVQVVVLGRRWALARPLFSGNQGLSGRLR